MKNKPPFQEHCQTGTTVPAGLPLFLIGGIFMTQPKLVNELGMSFPTPTSKKRLRYGIFECPFCLKEFRASFLNIRAGTTHSCGCYKVIRDSERMTVHGMSRTPVYRLWSGIKNRCNNVSHPAHGSYKDKGIIMSKEWYDSFDVFCKWAFANGYKKGLQIDRKDNNGNYEPGNCRFVTNAINGQNTRLLRANNTSGYRGICKSGKKWTVSINVNKVTYRLGTHPTKELAAQVYNDFVIKNKTFHPLNIIQWQPTETATSK